MDQAINDILIAESNEHRHRALVAAIVQMGFDFVLGRKRSKRFIDYASAAEIEGLYRYSVPRQGLSLEDLIRDELSQIADLSVSTGDPRYIAFPDSANSISSQIANILAGFLNQNMITFERGAPAATYVERQLLRWHRELIGYDYCSPQQEESLVEVGGMVTSGGNASNILALAAALHKAYPEARQDGFRGLTKRPIIYVSGDVEHFSYETGACLLGIGESSLRYVAIDKSFRTSMEDLRRLIRAASVDERPIAISVYAGNTRTSSIDNIQAAADIAAEYGLWLHVDACHGGSLLFRKDHRQMLAGIERADSVSVDPHKTLLCTYPLSLLLFKDGADLARISRAPQKASDPGNVDLGLMAPLYGSRGFESLKAWLVVKNLGTDALGTMAQERMDLAAVWHDMLSKSEMFVPLHWPDMYKVAFVAMPLWLRESISSLPAGPVFDDIRLRIGRLVDEANNGIADSLYKSGAVCIDKFRLRDRADMLHLGNSSRVVLGSVVANPAITQGTLSSILADMTAAATRIYEIMKPQIARICVGESNDIIAPLDGSGGIDMGPASWAGMQDGE
jgi:glutamate/tyrosine decarboxylase-like PLP-dependent enzyme